jgi:hypothetical protein
MGLQKILSHVHPIRSGTRIAVLRKLDVKPLCQIGVTKHAVAKHTHTLLWKDKSAGLSKTNNRKCFTRCNCTTDVQNVRASFTTDKNCQAANLSFRLMMLLRAFA